jgi:hypothetical protein
MEKIMETCKTCFYWENGRCDRVDGTSHPDFRFEIESSAADDYNLETSLRTGPDFGCVLHEPKEGK